MNAPRSSCPINLTLEALGDRWSLIVPRRKGSPYARKSLRTEARSCVRVHGGTAVIANVGLADGVVEIDRGDADARRPADRFETSGC